MSNLDLQNINVLNYNRQEVYIDTAKERYRFNASKDGKTPAFIPMTMAELKWICNNTNVLQIGLLTFEDDEKEEIYKELRIMDWKDILTNEDIEDIILNPDIDKLTRILEIENKAYYDRVRTICFRLQNEGKDISNKVTDIVDRRYMELQHRIRKTNIVLSEKDTQSNSVGTEEVKKLSEQNELLQKQLDEMKAMMAQLIANNNNNNIEVVSTEEPKKRGRKPATNVE